MIFKKFRTIINYKQIISFYFQYFIYFKSFNFIFYEFSLRDFKCLHFLLKLKDMNILIVY